jgi:hypothetical protein
MISNASAGTAIAASAGHAHRAVTGPARVAVEIVLVRH